ncbi:MAG: lamin tail domain-containing protein [Phycisphaeraceae bacterium]|nr:lamin tail domain-containing protein [Phycisphaeraceae bacterium]
MLTICLTLLACAADPGAAKAPPVKFPHPLITEILYAVPTGEKGDANHDGKRDATGDEFIELTNPHDKPIELRGYSLQDKSKGRAGSLSFTFPVLTLKPGEVAVVFNGNGATWTGPVGDEKKAPAGPNPGFGNAWVFSMKTTSQRTALANSGDAVLLVAPDRAVVSLVKWGKIEETLPQATNEEDAPLVTKSSVQRRGVDGPFVAHDADGGLPFSPGVFGKAVTLPEAPSVTEPNPRTPGDDKDRPSGPAPKKPRNGPPPPR